LNSRIFRLGYGAGAGRTDIRSGDAVSATAVPQLEQVEDYVPHVAVVWSHIRGLLGVRDLDAYQGV
jgi:hypothetical protein